MRNIIWVVDRSNFTSRICETYERFYTEQFGRIGVELRFLDAGDLLIGSRSEEGALPGDPASTAYFVSAFSSNTRSHDYLQTLVSYLELRGFQVASQTDFAMGLKMDNKFLASTWLFENAFPAIETYLLPPLAHNERDPFVDFIAEKFAFPMVIKPNCLAMGYGVFRVADRDSLRGVLDTIAGQSLPYIVQPSIDYVEEQRVYLAGETVLAAVAKKFPPRGFVSNYARGGTSAKAEVTEEVKRVCTSLARLIPSGFLSVDLLIGAEGAIHINEVDTVSAAYSYACLDADDQLRITKAIHQSILQQCDGAARVAAPAA